MQLEPIQRLTRDIAKAAVTLTDDEARFLVDAYYQMQENRIRTFGQVRSMTETAEPNGVLAWLATQDQVLENQIKRALDAYSAASPLGEWARSICGIGPVIASGLLAHIDLKIAETAGQIWRFAGLDPTSEWGSREKITTFITNHQGRLEDAMTAACSHFGRQYANVHSRATTDRDGEPIKLTKASIIRAVAMRPFNATLKVLAWKIGESFVKVQGNVNDIYGKVYAERKALEIARNDAGAFAEQAAAKLEKFKIGKDTDAYKSYSVGKLPPAHIHARAKRYAVKLFLAHYHEVGRKTLGLSVPAPYPIAFLGHAHKIEPPAM